MEKNQRFVNRLGFALAGLKVGLKEHSLRTQLVFALFAFTALVTIRPAPIWWGLVALTCAVILAAELFNTALEALCDHVSPEFQPAIKIAKDTAAGAVLILSVGALLVASALLYDHFVL